MAESRISFQPSTARFIDVSFPSDTSSLFWKYSSKKDMEMQNTYKDVVGWKTPSQLDDGETPSLWGSKGVRPAAIN
jgi:hypothetical protein